MLRDHGGRSGFLALAGTMSLALTSCGQGEDLAGPASAALQVTTETSGTGTDSDGYTVSIDGRLPVPIALVDTLLESGVTPGRHTVDLGGVAAGCTVEGGASRTLTAAVATTAAAAFTVVCTAPAPVLSGAVIVTVTTSGVELDTDGFIVVMDPSHHRAIGLSDEIRIEGVAAGERSIGLSGLAATCSVQGDNPRLIDVPPDGQVGTTFDVRCWSRAAGRIAFVRSFAPDSVLSLKVIGVDGSPLHSFITSTSDSVTRPAWSPDGGFIAYVGSSVFVQPLTGGAAVELPGCIPAGYRPVWSPDGSHLLCLSESGRLWSVERNGSDPRFLTPEDDLVVTHGQYLPDGRIFLVADDAQGERVAFRVTADGTNLTRLFTFPEIHIVKVAASPDGRLVAYVIFAAGLFVASIDGANTRFISSRGEDGGALVWSPDASRVALLDSDLDQGLELWLMSPDGAEQMGIPLPGRRDRNGVVDWSPDGTRLVVAVGAPDDHRSSIYTIRADGRGLERLTATDSEDVDPAWAP